MTAMDQAFIRAYRQQGEEAMPSIAARPAVPLSEMLVEEPAGAAAPASARRAAEMVSLQEAAATSLGDAGSIERLFTRLARPSSGSIEATLPKRNMVSAAETLGIVRPILRADPGAANVPLSAVLAPHNPAIRDKRAAETPRNVSLEVPLGEKSADEISAAAAAAAIATSVAVESETAAAMEPAALARPTANLWSLASSDMAESPASPAEEAASSAEACAAAPAPWQPLLQVEHVVWPRICTQLHMVAVRQLDRLAAAILAAAESGRKALAVGGCRAGDGATTLLLCAARQLARSGMRVLAADACFDDPQLARRLGMLPDLGWQDVLAGRAALEEAIIVSTEDRLALLPAATRPSSPKNDFALASALDASLDELVQHYDVILVDVGSLEDRLSHMPPMLGGASRLDAAVVVHNLRSTNAVGLAKVERKLADAGVAEVGVIENFVRSS